MPTENILFRVPFGYLDVKIILCSILNFAQSFTREQALGTRNPKEETSLYRLVTCSLLDNSSGQRGGHVKTRLLPWETYEQSL